MILIQNCRVHRMQRSDINFLHVNVHKIRFIIANSCTLVMVFLKYNTDISKSNVKMSGITDFYEMKY